MEKCRLYWIAALLSLFALTGFVNNNDLYNVRLNNSNIDADKIFLLIDKSDYRMYVYEDVTLRKIYKVVFGNRDQTDKRREGDRLTPEGTFHIQSKRIDRLWSRFLLLDYPNEASIQKFRTMQDNGVIAASATPGGGIGIHGVESGSGITDAYVEGRINWTLGCISMKNRDVNELFEFIKVGTPVVIRK
ncbi:murein L,D-transpeptidase family protein [Chitinophaga sp. sic0106]|uniref:L,D-transpeptidase family protein n=1 Tax=Chitinophaga sp. sic0106 TaxID=2854785 RepID=UPI001C493D05|nr:L,D-transpeptidase [Chitinophaga sp. sic0106]MBV7528862.1 L,D-transpeptidase [Chitinophaga sp. sic0106]